MKTETLQIISKKLFYLPWILVTNLTLRDPNYFWFVYPLSNSNWIWRNLQRFPYPPNYPKLVANTTCKNYFFLRIQTNYTHRYTKIILLLEPFIAFLPVTNFLGKLRERHFYSFSCGLKIYFTCCHFLLVMILEFVIVRHDDCVFAIHMSIKVV